MTEKIIIYTITLITVSTAFVFLKKGTRKSIVVDEKRQFNLIMNKLYGIAGIMGLILGLLFLIFLPMTAESNGSQVWLGVIIMLLIFWGTGIPCLMYYRNHEIKFDSNSVVVKDVFGKTREIKWTEILDIKFKAMSGLLVLNAEDEKKLKVHQHLVGLSKFVEFVENKTKWTSKELKIPIEKK